ncbi:hypothetical protein B0H11DRAFT_1911228 [Mycena galericulata]|nr:hypothetical protein B0H11DRAFT_1911228 [Mycena galericulata]
MGARNSGNLTRRWMEKRRTMLPWMHPTQSPLRTKSEVLREEIDRLVDLALEYDEKYKIPDQTTKKRPREPKHGREVEELKSYSQLLNEATKKAIEELEFPEIIENGMYHWVWSQMVRFNGTVARLTCHNIGVILTRHRDNQTLSVSNFVEHTDTPILLTTALTVYAYTDAVQRHDEHLANEEPLWIEDLYRGETRAAQKDDETSSEDEEYQQPPKNKRGGRGGRRGGGGRGIRATQKDDETSSEDEEDQQPPKNKRGGRGGRRGGGGRGSRRGGGGAGGHGRGSNDRDQGGPSGGSGGNNDNSRDGRSHQQSQDRQARLDKRNNVNANNAHLAFRARGKHLWSRGFSHFKRVEPEATAAPASNPSDLTHRSQDLPRRVYLPGFGIGSTIPDQQRRASGGSIESGGSSDSTRTSVPSLFSEQTSSVPPSPVTTSSFTNQLSRDSSPSPEKLSGHQAGSENAAATTVSDVGIVIDDVLGESAIGIVWSGKMILEDGVDDNNSISIAVKMAVPKENVDGIFGEDDREIVRHEGLVYDYLTRAAKMEISPRYYGIFEDNVGSVALILDNGGAALKDFKKLTGRQAQTLFEKAVEMHSVGVIHNDLVPRNVVQDSDGELRIIDFHVANLNHRCAGKEECEELSMFSQALGL